MNELNEAMYQEATIVRRYLRFERSGSMEDEGEMMRNDVVVLERRGMGKRSYCTYKLL